PTRSRVRTASARASATFDIAQRQHCGRAVQEDGRRRHDARTVSRRWTLAQQSDRGSGSGDIRSHVGLDRVRQGGHAARAGGDDDEAFRGTAGHPTVAEFVPGYEATSWYGVGAPKATPAEIVDKLNKEINAGLADPKMKARLADLGNAPLALSPADFGKLIADETEKWGNVTRALNIKAERRRSSVGSIFHNVPVGEQRCARRRVVPRLDSERFRSAPRTCRHFRGMLSLR